MKKIWVLLMSMLVLVLSVAIFSGCPQSPDDNGKTPSATNSGKCPAFSPIGGFFKTKQTVTISCDDAASIYYTILKPTFDSEGNWDETAWKAAVASSKPTEESKKYEKPFEVGEQCIIRAVAVKSDGSKNYAMTCFDFDLDRTTDTTSQTPTNPDSENWQDQTIYFILTDRFFDGDTTNNHTEGLKDQDGNDYDESVVLPGQPASGYNGGDLDGIRQKLRYIKDLGFTAIWMTPPIENQISEGVYHGYHGYWASDFTKVDPHIGTLAKYQQFVKEAHDMGLYVIQDIVVNHTGDYQKITADITDDMMKANAGNIPERTFYLNSNSVPLNHPTQLPWAFNNLNDLTYDEWKNNTFFHFNTGVSDYTDLDNMHTHSSSDLDDIVTENDVVRNLLRGYFRYWIDKVGIDGYRIDTALYVEPEFFEGFINSTDSDNMGVRTYGISKGKKDFIDFGEAFTQSETTVGSYTTSSPGKRGGTPRMDGMLYFPLRYAISDTISSGTKTSAIGDVLRNRQTKNYYYDSNRLVTFIDNHDMDRWAYTVNGDSQFIKMAYNLIYTIPGIPQVYYGSEQGFAGEDRAGMFKGSFLSAGQTQSKDYFDTDNEWYKYFQNLNKMRKENRVFRYNTIYVLQETDDSAGIFAFIARERSENGDILSGVKNKAIYVMNTSSSDKVLDASYQNIAVGDKFSLVNYDGISSCPATGTEIQQSFTAHADSSGRGNVKFIVPAHSCAVYILDEVGAATSDSTATLEITSVPTDKISGNSATVKGKTSVSGEVKIILNGDYSSAITVNATADTEFSAELDLSAYSNGTYSVQLIQVVNGVTNYSEKKSFSIERPFKLIAKVTDPKGDDNGVGAAKGILQKPTAEKAFDTSFDIQGVDVYRSGNDIRLGVRMSGIAHTWGPTSNLFDHVMFYVFVSDGDDKTGCEYHPGANYKLPDSFGKWNYMFQCYGWGQAYYSSEGASETALGKLSTPGPENYPDVAWDKIPDDDGDKYVVLDWSDYNPEIGSEFEEKPGMIYFTISAAAMGYPSDISGYKFYINTWDYGLAENRALQEGTATAWNFGTGTLSLSECPRVCDETDIIAEVK